MPTADAEFTWTITIGDEEIDVPLYVEFEYEPYVPAQLYGPPEQCYPAEGGGVFIISCLRTDTDEPVTLSEAETAKLEEYLADHYLPDDDEPDYDYERWDD